MAAPVDAIHAVVRHITPVRGGAALSVSLTLLAPDGEASEDRALTVSVEDYAAMRFLHPYAKAGGRELDFDQIAALDEAEERFAAIEQGLSLLSYGDNTEATLVRKLRERGYAADVAASATAQLAARGYIDEVAQVDRYLRGELKKGRGASRILGGAREKRFGEAAMVHLRDALAELDFAALCAVVIEKKYGRLPVEPKERQKAAASLMRQGFSWSEIKAGDALAAQNV